MKLLSALRFSSCSAKPCCRAGRAERGRDGRADHRSPGFLRADPRHDLPHAACTASGVALPFLLKSLMPSSQITPSRRTARARRAPGARSGRRPAGERLLRRIFRRPDDLVAADAGVDHRHAMARGARSRRASTSGQRSSPFMVEPVPSVIESPNATITCVSAGATCRPRRGNTRRPSEGKRGLVLAWPFEPAAGRGHVGGLQRFGVPGHRTALAGDMEADRELAAGERLRVAHERQRDRVAPDDPCRARSSRSACRRRSPAGWCRRPAWRCVCCRPTKTPSNVTGLVPKALEKRSRACLPQISGSTISRNV